MHRTVHFKTAEPEEWTFDENENPKIPGGELLAQKLRARVEGAVQSVSVVSQHEYYGWRFEVTFEAVTVHCVLNAAGDECYLTVELGSFLPSWLLPRRTRRAFAGCQRVFDAVLHQLPEVSGVTWL
jgi:hypothetical protein